MPPLLAAVIRDDPRPVSAIRRGIPPEIRSIVVRCLQENPAERYASGSRSRGGTEGGPRGVVSGVGRGIDPGADRPRSAAGAGFGSALVIAFAIAAGVVWLVKRSRDVHWAREVALPKIAHLTMKARLPGGLRARSVKAEKSIPDDPSARQAVADDFLPAFR